MNGPGEDWVLRAQCRAVEDDAGLFPEGHYAHGLASVTIRTLCSGCPVTQECWTSRNPRDRNVVRGGRLVDHRGRVWTYLELLSANGRPRPVAAGGARRR